MVISITGASGFIGQYISTQFSSKGYKVIPIDRSMLQNTEKLLETICNSDVVINLAGAPINHRWTKSYKEKLYTSRIDTTKKIVNVINSSHTKPKLLISTSAIGFYPSNSCYDEYNSKKGLGFLSDLTQEWETTARNVSNVRLVITRFAVVLSKKGGAYEKMVKPAKLGIAGIIGNGNQPFSWIDIEDLFRAMNHIIQTPSINGIVNIVSPEQLTNKQFTIIIAKHYKSIITIRIPLFILRLFMGESSEILSKGQCVKPTKLLKSGFKFVSSNIKDFLSHI